MEARPGRSAYGDLGVAALIAAAILILYGRTAGFPFIILDDAVNVTGNEFVRRGGTWPGLLWAFTSRAINYWHPLTWISHMGVVSLFGTAPGPHHLANVFLHLMNSLLLHRLVLRISGSRWKGALVAGIFAVHPLNVESVAWVSARNEMMTGLFFFLTVFAYIRYAERPVRGFGGYLGVSSLFLCALMSKPVAVTIPLVLLLLDYWPLARMSTGKRGPGLPQKIPSPVPMRRLILEKLPWLAMSAAVAADTYLTRRSLGMLPTLDEYDLWTRLKSVPVSYVRYLGETLWPSPLMVLNLHPGRGLPLLQTMAAIGFLALVTVVLVRRRRESPSLITGWLWFLATLLPVIGFVQTFDEGIGDRKMYFPVVGLLLLLVEGGQIVALRLKISKKLLAAGAGVVVLSLSMLAYRQVGYWRSSVALFGHSVQVAPGNYWAHTWFGLALAEEGKNGEAIVHLREGFRLRPDRPYLLVNLGNLLHKEGRLDEAEDCYRRLLLVDPSDVKLLTTLGVLLSEKGRLDEAEACLRRALHVEPEDSEVLVNLGVILCKEDRWDEGADCFRKAIGLAPGNVDARFNLGVVLLGQGRAKEAAEQFGEIRRLAPQNRKLMGKLEEAQSGKAAR